MEYLLVPFLLFGFNFIFWFCIGWVRMASDRVSKTIMNRRGERRDPLTSRFDPVPVALAPEDVAVIVPAYNEELVIADTIESLLPIVPAQNILVNTYGSKDKTAQIAREYGVIVLDREGAGKAKAEKLANTVKILNERGGYAVALFVDADTRLDRNFLINSLPYFSDPDVVAVAGYATTLWERRGTSFWNMFYVAYRERMYLYMQMIVKYAQTWKGSNVCPIVPGFASMYRMSALPKIDIDPKGLVIEDFNMTFEVHHKRLGKIAHHRSVFATTQDPDNFDDYVRQVNRWDLGFWQTVRRHGFWPSVFSVSLAVYVFDVLMGSLILLVLPLIVLVLALPSIVPSALAIGWFESVYVSIHSVTDLSALLIGLFAIDYTLTIVAAAVQKRPQYLIYGLGFMFLRYVDSLIYVVTLPKAFRVNSSGRWKSPTRR